MKPITKQNVFRPSIFPPSSDGPAVITEPSGLQDGTLLTQLVYTPREVEVLLHLSKNTVNSLLNRGTLRGRRVGRKWLIPRGAIQEFLEAQS
ncbi:helix-turn-helix domain-containing protein [Deinococcus sp. RM]|uniref:helix-turn-helix domain-containing protein n=1 Tax=Deinococcus sp. RM TaxID=2316359 RepID=UPI000E680573|nr:helix-turn-helix domain-containing protein [Deinococcus sp. RM]RIY15917.1 DNA-binding protein [Deinococcus sp. RM]